MLNLTPLLPLLPYVGWAVALLLLWLWLRRALTPAWVVQLLESERLPSVRLALASVVVVFTLSMEAAGRLAQAAIDANLIFAGTLLGLGVAKVTVSRFSPKPTVDPTEQPEPETKNQ
ncbi:MAG: hypothetical protein ACRYFX_07275 [Janthinobacterium lividum]